MSFKAVYTCDICREDALKANIRGCNFSGMRTFKISDAESTQGVHICIGCLDQLKAQLCRMGSNYAEPTNLKP